MIITVGNTKGGVGKTTLAVQLAIARALAGRDVWLIDGDLMQQGQLEAVAADADRFGQLGKPAQASPDGSAFFTVTPRVATSCARDLLMPISPALAAA